MTCASCSPKTKSPRKSRLRIRYWPCRVVPGENTSGNIISGKATAKLVVTLSCAAAAFLLVVFVYNNDPRSGYGLPPCGFKEVTGYHCPGCGGTRAFYFLLHGKIKASFYHNPILILGSIVATFAIAALLIMRRKGIRTISMTAIQGALFAFAIIGSILLFGIVRNLPWYPFLKPPKLQLENIMKKE